MKWLLSLAALAAQAFAQEEIKKISPEELKQLLGDKVVFLDVRTPAEIAELGTLKGHLNIPIDDLEKRIAEIPKDKRIITACNAGIRATRAAALLKAKGYDVIGACGLKGAEGKLDLVRPKALPQP